MNSCILMAEIIQQPQLRYTPDNQLQIAEMLVQFPGPKPEDPPEHLKVIGWGNFAQEIHEKYHEGDRVIIEGRLSMNTIERDGIKEKRAELTAQRIYSVGADAMSAAPPTRTAPEPAQRSDSAPANVPSNVVPLGSRAAVLTALQAALTARLVRIGTRLSLQILSPIARRVRLTKLTIPITIRFHFKN
jgi:single-stranded DNA-binding protein